jgi:AcrR family transcriptional regulator
LRSPEEPKEDLAPSDLTGWNSEGSDSPREARKARTRSDLRRAAQNLFAERGFDTVTVAEVSAAAGMSVQTIFNHFASKEELFFDGRTAWVDGPAEAVRVRHPAATPLSALRHHLVGALQDRVHFEASPEGQAYIAAVTESPALGAHERKLLHEAEGRLEEALADASAAPTDATLSVGDSGPGAALTAAMWLAAVRALVVFQRTSAGRGEDKAADVAALADRMLRNLDACLLR